MGDQLKGWTNLAECLIGKVNFVNIIKANPISGKRNIIMNERIGNRGPMVIILDGAIQRDMDLEDINPDIVHSIEVLGTRSTFGIYSQSGYAGALVITTKHPGDKDYYDIPSAPGTLKYVFKGFYITKEFYSPKYDTPKSNNAIPDLRSTIYWNPNLVTDEKGKASVEYFNSDTKGTYRVVIEGIDGDGNLGREVYRYKVEQ
jgi:hypothetical protein